MRRLDQNPDPVGGSAQKMGRSSDQKVIMIRCAPRAAVIMTDLLFWRY
jgi:hypothetical protein